MLATLAVFGQRVQVGQIKISDKGLLKITECKKAAFKNPEINHIYYSFESGRVKYIKIYFKDSSTTKNPSLASLREQSKAFDLTFRGDSLMLMKDYPSLHVPSVPYLTSQTIFRKKDNSIDYVIAEATQYTDSIDYIYTRGYTIPYGNGYGMHAKYYGSLKDLAMQIRKRLAEEGLTKMEETEIVFLGKVDKKGKFGTTELIYGTRSRFADIAEDVLNKSIFWKSAINATSGGAMDINLKVYVKKDNSNEITLQLPERLYNFTGD